MHETEDDLAVLQEQLDRSFAAAGPHLRNIFEERNRPAAADLARALDGIEEVHVGCTTGDGAPIVAPVDGIFYRGHWWIGFPSGSVRAGLVRRDPRVSVSYNEDGVTVIVHGAIVEPAPDRQAAYDALMRELYVKQYGDWWGEWFDSLDKSGGAGGYVEPRRFFAQIRRGT